MTLGYAPHPYRPFTTRDGSQACAVCYATPDDPIHSSAAIGCSPTEWRWCQECDCQRRHRRLSAYCFECVECGELSVSVDVAIADARYVLRWLLQVHECEQLTFELPANIEGLARRAVSVFRG